MSVHEEAKTKEDISPSLMDTFRSAFSSFVLQSPTRPLKILLFTHRQADPDALCAAAGLSILLPRAFSDFKFESSIVAPRGASTLGTTVCRKLNVDFKDTIAEREIDEADLIVVVDLSESLLLEPFLKSILKNRSKKVLIDHHTSSVELIRGGNSPLAEFSAICNAEATSTCEIIVKGFPDDLLDKRAAEILLTGMLFDSQHLGLATAFTLEAALSLVRAGAKMDEARSVLRSRPDRSEVIARVKSAQRIHFEECGKYVLLDTEVSSFQASVARMLVEIGGDVGIAYGKNDDEFRLSVRSTQRFHQDTGIDMGAELKKIADLRNQSAGVANATGGGHSTAASLSGKYLEPAVMKDALVDSIRLSLPQ